MLFFSYIATALAFALYSPSPHDFIVDPQNGKYDEHSGFVNRHYYVQDKYHFGELNILTLNTHIESDLKESNQATDLLELIDTHHPTVFTLQGLSRAILPMLEEKLGQHYQAACRDSRARDLRTYKLESMPILYDSARLSVVRESVFEPKDYDEQVYGCGVVFYDSMIREMYTVVNVDLLSAVDKVTDAELYNILDNVNNSEFKSKPLLIAGTINSLSAKAKRLVENTMHNLNELDKNNEGLSRTTFHNGGKVNDNIQRDFILLRDNEKRLKLNYSRTLSRFRKDDFGHFPIYSILSRVEADVN